MSAFRQHFFRQNSLNQDSPKFNDAKVSGFMVVAIYTIYGRVNGLHNIPPLLPPGDHAHVQNSWHLLE